MGHVNSSAWCIADHLVEKPAGVLVNNVFVAPLDSIIKD